MRLEGSGSYIHNSTDFVDGGQTDGRTTMTRWDGLGHDTVTHYDFAGRPFIVQNPGHSGTAPTSTVPNQSMSLYAEYDDASRITAIHDGDGGKTQYWRDGSGRVIQRAMVTHGALISLWNTKEILKRDAIGRLTEMNVFGSLAATGGVPDHALPIATEEFQTDSVGRTHKEEYSFTFAPANALEVTSSWSGGNPYRSTLDYADNLGSGSTAPLSMDFGHDTIGRLTSIDWTGHSGSTTALADYEWVGGLRRNRFVRYSASSYPEGKTSFGYDAYNRLTKIKDDVYTAGSTFTTESQFDYEYDLASNLIKEKYAKVSGGLGDRFAYDGYHRLTEAWMGVLDATVMAVSTNPSGWVSGQVHSYLTYDLDDANNRTETGVQDAGGTATTGYDLQGGSHPQGPSNRYDAVGPLGGALTPYEYDGRGNLIRDGVFVFRYDYLNRLQEVWKIRVDGDDDTEQYALVQEGADEEARQEVKLEVPDLMQRLPREHMTPTFRARLRAQITGGVIRLRGTGQGGGGMPSFTTPAQADLHAVYAYDAYNRRIMGIVVGVDTQFHTWDGWRQVVQYSLDTAPSPDAAVPTKQFVWGSELDELLSYRRKSGSSWENYFVLHGGQGAAAKLVNSSGAVVEQYEYDPYGKVSVYVGSSTTAVATSSVGLPFLWKGVRLDSETGLLQMRNRYYSTSLGRFLSSDPLGAWLDHFNFGNEYAFVGNNAPSRQDPLGLTTAPFPPLLWIIGAAFLAGCSSSPQAPLGPPAGDLKKWIGGRFLSSVSKGNCYRYALDDPMQEGEDHGGGNPGNLPGPGDPGGEDWTCERTWAGIKADGHDECKSGACPLGFRKILVVVRDDYKDYHFYRQDDNGSWSHKRGEYPPQWGVADPEANARKIGYRKCHKYFCVKMTGCDADVEPRF